MKKPKKSSPPASAQPAKPAKPSSVAPARTAKTAPNRLYWRHACLRIQYIHDEIGAGRYPNRTTIAQHFECDERTIGRDIEYMRDQLNAPIEYDSKRYGFYYSQPFRELPRPKISQGQMLAICIARRSLERYKGTGFAAEIAAGLRRLCSQLSSEIDFSWEDLDQGISFRACNLDSAEDLALSRVIHQAILDAEELEFHYWGLHGAKPEPRCVYPYHLMCDGKGWYLYGKALDRNDDIVREFHLIRISQLKRTGRYFEKPENFSPDDKLKHSIGVYGGDTPERVRLRLGPIPARILSENPLHPTQKITKVNGSEPELTMDVAINPELEREILRWAEEIEVLEPLHLREKIFARARAVLARETA